MCVCEEVLRFGLLLCIVMLNTGSQGLVAHRDERICTYSVTLLLSLKPLIKKDVGIF